MDSKNKSQKGLKHTWSRIVYVMRVLVLLAAVAFSIWIFQGDIYVAVALILSAAGVFVSGLAPGLVPELVQYMVQTPFMIGLLIPLWNLGEELLRWERMPILWAAVTLGTYALSVLMLLKMPARMRDPFEPWLPAGAIPPEQMKARKERTAQPVATSGYGSYSSSYTGAQTGTYTATHTQTTEAPKEKKRGFSFRRKKAEQAQPQPTSSYSRPPAEAPVTPGKKRGFSFRRKKAEQAQPQPTSSYSRPPAEAPVTPGKKRGFSFRRKKAEQAQPQPTSSYSRPPAEAPVIPGKKRRLSFGFGRKKREETPETRPVSPFSRDIRPTDTRATHDDQTGAAEQSRINPFKREKQQTQSPAKPAAAPRQSPAPQKSTSPFYFPDEDEEEDAMGMLWDLGDKNNDLIEKIRAKRKSLK